MSYKVRNKVLAYIIAKDPCGKPVYIAEVFTDLKSRETVKFSRQRTRDHSLVNASVGTISRAKKWYYASLKKDSLAMEISTGNFFIVD